MLKYITSKIYWNAGIISVAAGSFNLILLLRTFPYKPIGLCFIMFLEIFKTFLKILPNLGIFFLSFILLFDMTSIDPIFSKGLFNKGKPFFWVLTRIISGPSDEDLKGLSDGSPNQSFEYGSYVILVCFVLLMNFILFNLATGLAIGDVQKVIGHSENEFFKVKMRLLSKLELGAISHFKEIFTVRQHYLLPIEFFREKSLEKIDKAVERGQEWRQKLIEL